MIVLIPDRCVFFSLALLSFLFFPLFSLLSSFSFFPFLSLFFFFSFSLHLKYLLRYYII